MGTKYDSSITNKTYARLDTQSQSWYFTDKNGTFLVKFIINGEEYTGQVVNHGDRVREPVLPEWITVEKWIDEDRQEFDFENTVVKKYTELHAMFSGNYAIFLPW